MIRSPRRLSAAMLALFFHQLAVLVGSGTPPGPGLAAAPE